MSKVDINLRGKSISIGCAEGQEDHIASLAKRYEARLEALAKTIGDVGDTRLMVAAGLSLIDELDQIKTNSTETAEIIDLDNRISLIERSAASALSDAATRINRIAERLEDVG